MARARNIKPGLFKNEVLGVADPLYTLLFEGLWVLADRSGRLEDRPLRIKAEVFPYRDGISMPAMLDWLQANGFIRRYTVGGSGVIQILNFEKHQNPHKNEAESELPSIESADAPSEKIGSAPESIGSTRADSLSTDSGFLIPDTAPPVPAPKAPPFDPLAVDLPSWLPAETWQRWVKHRGSIRKPIKTPDTVAACFKSLEAFVREGVSVESVVTHAIASGNQGLYAPPRMRGHGPPAGSDRKSRQLETAALMTGATRAEQPPEFIDVPSRLIPS